MGSGPSGVLLEAVKIEFYGHSYQMDSFSLLVGNFHRWEQ
jgi:hypothetical protein